MRGRNWGESVRVGLTAIFSGVGRAGTGGGGEEGGESTGRRSVAHVDGRAVRYGMESSVGCSARVLETIALPPPQANKAM